MLLFKFFLLFLTLITSSQALFFHYSKNALWNFFDSLKAKKEFKKLPNIHHYHVHYYPVFLHSSHSLIKTVKAPDNHEIENLHSNKLESYGWSGDYKYTPDVIQSYPSWDPWSSTFSYTKQPWALNKRSLDQAVDTAKSDAGVVVQVPLQQQIIVQQPKNDEDTSNPILTFFRRLRDIKNSIFSPATERSDVVNSKMDGLVVFTKPNADLEDFHQLSDE